MPLVHIRTPALALCLALSAATPALHAQVQPTAASTSPAPAVTRQQLKMDRDEFLRAHEWDDLNDTWRLRSGFEPPVGVKSRSEVRAARDSWLHTHRWDQTRGNWVERDPATKMASPLSREAARADTRRFMQTHRWDEMSETWVDRPQRKPM